MEGARTRCPCGEPPLWWAITDATARRIRVRIRPRRRWTPRSSRFRNTHPAWDDDPESDLRILRDRHVIRLARRLRCDRFVAAARCKLWWMTPTWGAGGDALVNSSPSTEAGIPAETQFVLFELNGGSAHVAAVPIISDGFRCTLSGHVNDCRNTDDDDDDEGVADGTPDGTPGERRCVLALVAESNCERETCDGVDAALALAAATRPFERSRRRWSWHPRR